MAQTVGEYSVLAPNVWELCNRDFYYEPCQNLVKNPSFSMYEEGGVNFNDFHNLSGMCPWTMPVLTNVAGTHTTDVHPGTPNAFHESIGYVTNGVPNNEFGNENDEIPNLVCDMDDYPEQKGYAGVYVYAADVYNQTTGGTTPVSNYREYIQQKMNAPLQAGKTYSVSLRVSLSDKSKKAVPFSILFSSTRPNYEQGPAFNWENPGMVIPNGNLIDIPITAQKTGWKTYTFTYTHSGPDAQYITIGNFKTDVQLAAIGGIISVGGSTALTTVSYYYIDDIAVYDLSSPCCTPAMQVYEPCAYPGTPSVMPVISGAAGECMGGNLTVGNVGAFPAGTLFSWSYQPDGGGATLAGQGASFSLTAIQTYSGGVVTLTVQAPYACPVTAQKVIKSCCVPPGYSGNTSMLYVATGQPGSNKASDVLAHFGGAVPSGAQLVVNGIFDVNVNFSWNSVEAAFGADAKMTLSNNSQFQATNSHLFACNQMWQGIEVDQPSEKVTLLGSKLEHAYNGIYSYNGGNFEIGNSVFNRNQVHVYLMSYAGTHPGKIYNSQFTCDNDFGVLEYLRPPLDNEFTQTGILALGVTKLNVGADLLQNTTGNLFRFAGTHILGLVSGFDVRNTRFERMLGWQPPAVAAGGLLNLQQGVAICVYGPNTTVNNALALNVGGATAAEACEFDGNVGSGSVVVNSGAAISSTDNIHVTVKNTDLRNLKYGVVVNKLTGAQQIVNNVMTIYSMNLNVTDNTFYRIDSCAVYGVAYLRAAVDVKNNLMQELGNKGVYFGNVSNTSKFLWYNVSYNQVSGLRPVAGIHLINCPRTKVYGNNVLFTSATASNFTTGTTLRYGIRAESCLGIDIRDNVVKRNSTSAIFASSTALRLQGINVAGSQNAYVCNNECRYLSAGYHFMLNNSGIRIRKNRAFDDYVGIQFTNANIAPPTTDGEIPWDNEWYNIYGGNTTKRLTGTSSGTNVWRWRNNGNTNFNPYTHSVSGFPLINVVGSNPGQYITCTSTGVPSIDDPEKREAVFGSTVDGTLTYTPDEEEALSLMDEKAAYLYLANDAELWATDNPADDKFRTFVSTRETGTLGAISEAQTRELEGDKTAALASLASAIPSTTAEVYERTVNDIYLRRWMADTAAFDSTDLEQLALIAGLSYKEGGPAVLGARVLLGGDFVEMESKMAPLDGQKIPTPSRSVTLYPNPNQGFINFGVEDPSLGFGFELYTVQGVRVFTQTMGGNNLPQGVNMGTLPQGLYIYRITMDNGKIENGSLMIVKP